MRDLLLKDMSGNDVLALKQRIAIELGNDATRYKGLLNGKNTFDSDTQAAIMCWQAGVGLVSDGIMGPHGLSVLGLRPRVALQIVPDLGAVRQLFPQTKPSNIVRYLPYVTCALEASGLTGKLMVLAALGTLRAETAGFVPISEYVSQFNTLPGKPPFSAYEPGTRIAKNLGNTAAGDGATFRGRGFVQLTGRSNYTRYGKQLGIDLIARPELANSAEVAAMLLATFLASNKARLQAALALNSAEGLKAARRYVNGGSHGLAEFSSVFALAKTIWPDSPAKSSPAGAAAKVRPGNKQSAAPAASQKPATPKTRDTHKDPFDARDRLYQPPPVMLADQYPADSEVSDLFSKYRQLKLVLNQGDEGACTGFGLACVINFARWQKSGWGSAIQSVSPRMLFNFARRYDEYAGEDYEYSSCRGALKGWFNHGVCMEADWPYHGNPKYGYLDAAAKTSLGVYYRIDIQSVVDMQTAITQTHAIFVSAITHQGWDDMMQNAPTAIAPSHANLPVIAYSGHPAADGGHAFALVGFNTTGFIVQNSWGANWGHGGFAVLTYADWLANGMDAWVASLGVSGVTQGRLGSSASATKGRGAGSIGNPQQQWWWTKDMAYAHSAVFGDDGRVSRYVSADETTRTLQHQACGMPDEWFRTDPVAKLSGKRRLVIYAHGGLNSEADGIARAQAMGRYFTGNGCYPLFLVWKTGILESIADILAHRPTTQQPVGAAGGVSAWTDPLIEKTLGRGPVRGIWDVMKHNAAFSCTASRGGDLLITALKSLRDLWGDKLEIHLVGHSAGSIILGHLLGLLTQRGLKASINSLHLYAPACTIEFANQNYAPHADLMQRMHMHILSDQREQDDNTAYIYRKSLLYLVSNAAEPDVRSPLLGLCNARDATYTGWDGSSSTSEALTNWRAAVENSGLEQRTTIVKDAQVVVRRYKKEGEANFTEEKIASAHGAFDNDIKVVSSTITKIRGGELLLEVDDLRGF